MDWLVQKFQTIEGKIGAFFTVLTSLWAAWKWIYPIGRKGYHRGLVLVSMEKILSEIRHEMKKGFSELRDLNAHQAGIRMAQQNADLYHIYFHADLKGKITWISHTWTIYTGMGQDQARGSGWEVGVSDDSLQQILTDWQQAIDHRRTYYGRWILVNRYTNRRALCDVRADPLFGKDGTVSEFFGTITPEETHTKLAILAAPSTHP